MANIFENANRKVERYSCIKKDANKIDYQSDTYLANTKLRELEESKIADAVEKDLSNIHKKVSNQLKKEAVVQKSLYESQINIYLDGVTKSCKNELFKDIMFEVFYNSLPLDSEFLREHAANIKYLTDKYIDDNNGFKLLESTALKSNSIALKRMLDTCNMITNKVVVSRLNEAKETKEINDIDFALNDEEKQDFNAAKDDLDLEKISDLVKTKVLTVVKDEKVREEAEGQIREEIEQEIQNELEDKIEKTDDDGNAESVDSDDESTKKQDDLHEVYNRIVLNESPVETGTLFNSLLRSTYREILHENVAIQDEYLRNNTRSEIKVNNYDVDSTIDDDFNTRRSIDDDDDTPIEDREINMDLILAESITKYTLMEMLYTLKFEDYSYTNLNKLTERLLNVNDTMVPVMEAAEEKEGNNYIKLRAQFFKIFGNLKNKKDSEKSKKELLAMANQTSDEDAKHFKGFIDNAIKELERVKEKNPHMAKDCDSNISWLKDTLKNAVGAKPKDDEPEESDEDKEIKEMWNNIF